MKILIPRLTSGQAAQRLAEIEEHLRKGRPDSQLVRAELGDAVPNATGGRAPTADDIDHWRGEVHVRVKDLPASSTTEQALYAKELGRAIEDVIAPSRSDVAHDGTWSYLSLMLYPDLIARRWGLGPDGKLSIDRWIGAQLGRDRNYVKLGWRNWTTLGELMDEARPPLGEDEFLNLLERSSLARNTSLIRLATKKIIELDLGHGIARSTFTRELMKRISFQTGPLLLDALDERELADVVSEQADGALASLLQQPKRARP